MNNFPTASNNRNAYRKLCITGIGSFLFFALLSGELAGGIGPKFLDRVREIESSGNALAVGDRGRSIGAYQISRAAWSDVNVYRQSIGLNALPYSAAFHEPSARIFAAQYMIILKSRLAVALKRMPTNREIYAAYNTGFRRFKTHGFSLRHTPKTTQRALKKL